MILACGVTRPEAHLDHPNPRGDYSPGVEHPDDEAILALQAYYRVYKEHIPVAQLCRETAAVMQEFTRKLPPMPPTLLPQHICYPHLAFYPLPAISSLVVNIGLTVRYSYIYSNTQYKIENAIGFFLQSQAACGRLECRC